jgi:hypothetical protein
MVGPYLCGETQAGGFPAWLIAKREIRIRHSLISFLRVFDSQYQMYCRQWFQNVCPILQKHQVTSKKNGCIIGFQIENESFELFKGVPMGLADDMRSLCKAARDFGITVPLYTNDGWEAGSWVSRPDDYTIFGKKTFGIDIYGFDKYVVFCPTIIPVKEIYKGTGELVDIPEWGPNDVIDGFSNMESKVRKIGGGASTSPLFIPELQGGWFNHYIIHHTYDTIYSFYGEKFTRIIFETSLLEGIYMDLRRRHSYEFLYVLWWYQLGDVNLNLTQELVTLMYILATTILHVLGNLDISQVKGANCVYH